MPYKAHITRSTPGCFLFMVDQSGSMDELIDTHGEPERLEVPYVVDGMTYTHRADGVTKAECVADVINRALYDLVSRSMRHDGCCNYFDVGVIGYRSDRIGTALHGDLAERILQPLSLFESHPLRIETRKSTSSSVPAACPVWVDAEADGDTPMCGAFDVAIDAVTTWCHEHPRSHPPVVINITDGQSSDGDPEGRAMRLRGIETEDGPTLLFNLYFEPGDDEPLLYPNREHDLPGQHARTLFRMSSVFPEQMRSFALERGQQILPDSRMFGYRAGAEILARCFETATRASQFR